MKKPNQFFLVFALALLAARGNDRHAEKPEARMSALDYRSPDGFSDPRDLVYDTEGFPYFLPPADPTEPGRRICRKKQLFGSGKKG